jgi:signal transduction histidine kinase
MSSDSSEAPTSNFEDIDILYEFGRRPQRLPDYRAEHEAMAVLVAEMAVNPRNMLQKLVETAQRLCNADSAGISLLEGDQFRWAALSGQLAIFPSATMPRDASPCGICINRNAPQLMHLPIRYFPSIPKEPATVELLLIPFHDHGNPVGTVWIVAHSENRKFDREDERIVLFLAQFASAGWQLVKASEEASEGNRKKDEFIAVLSHELRNPISAMEMGLYALANASLDENLQKTVARLDRQTKRIGRVVNDIADLSRLVHRKILIVRTDVDLRILVLEVLEEWRERLKAANLTLLTQVPDAPMIVVSDRIRLTQVLDNLLSNATKFTDSGGTISLKLDGDHTNVIVQISDTGRGFEAVASEAIFQPFAQSGQSGVREHGLGLGLAISRQLIELLGGGITAQSDGLGRGAMFTLALPRGSVQGVGAITTGAGATTTGGLAG